jgi:acetyl esterase
MLLDTATGTFLEGLRAAGGKPLYEQTIEEVRAGIRMASLQLAAPAEEMHRVVDRRIPAPGREIGVRIYTPRPLSSGETLPIVLHFHGGGFVAGDLDTHDAIARYVATHADAIVIAVDYRLAPEHPFPAAVDDASDAVAWASAHAAEVGGDPARLAVAGDSAGANLSTVACLLATQRGGPRIAFQALVYPTVDCRPEATFASRDQFGGGDYFLSNRDMEWFRSLYLANVERDAADQRASPLAALSLAGLPPALVVTCGCDLLRDEGQAYAERLAAAGVPVEQRCFDGTIHACLSFAGAIPTGLDALSFVASRLRAALHQT